VKDKSEVPTVFAKFHKWLSNCFRDYPVASLQTDKAQEYIAGDMELYCEAAGIDLESGPPYTPELNGMAERKNRVILEKMRSL